MTYYRGILTEFTAWHANAIQMEGLPKSGYINGFLVPQNQETIAYSQSIQNPNKTDDYIWLYGRYPIENKTSLSQADIDALNWFPE